MRSHGSSGVTCPGYLPHILASLFIAAVVAVIYSNTLDAAFHLDDFKQVTGNPVLRSLDNLFSILTAQKRGVTGATFALNYAFGGIDIRGYHIVNISIHAINSILVYFMLFLAIPVIPNLKDRARRIALFSALLFAAHPVQTQAVTYITQRQESLSALFCLMALIFLILALRSSVQIKRVLLYAAIPICYLLAFYSKEIAVTLPALILLFDLYFAGGTGGIGQGSWLKRWPLHAVMGILLIFFAVTSMSALGGLKGPEAKEEAAVKSQAAFDQSQGPAAKPPVGIAKKEAKRPEQIPTAGFGVQGITSKHYFLTQFNVVTYYMALLLVPIRQNIDYDFPISKSLFASPEVRDGTRLIYPVPRPIVSLLIIIAILLAAFYLFKRSATRGAGGEGADAEGKGARGARGRIASYFIIWFFIVLSPTSSVIPIMDVIFEHRLYLASLGFFVIVVLFVDWVSACLFTGKAPRGV